MNSDLVKWLKERTETHYIPPPRHCLSGEYQPWHPRSLHTGMPQFAQFPPGQGKYEGMLRFIQGNEGISEEDGDEDAFSELEIRHTQLARETRNEFAEPLSGNDESEKRREYHKLCSQEQSRRRRSEELASAIDDDFKVEKPSGENSTVPDEASRLCMATKSLVDEHGPEATLGKVLSVEPEHQEWRLQPPVDSPLDQALSSPQHEAYSLLDPFFRAEERPCIDVEEQGFHCGLNLLPADATLKQVFKITELYFKGVKEEADRRCRTHALLSYRLQILQGVLQEYDLYEEAETWHFKDPQEIKSWRERKGLDDDDRELANLQLLLYTTEDVLSSRSKREEVWGGRGSHPVNFSGLHDSLIDVKGDPLAKDDEVPITPQWLGNLIKEFFEPAALEVLWREAKGAPNAMPGTIVD